MEVINSKTGKRLQVKECSHTDEINEFLSSIESEDLHSIISMGRGDYYWDVLILYYAELDKKAGGE